MARPPQRIPAAVAELQGLYGPFSFPERLLQKIWLNGEFDRGAAATTDGRRLQVLHPGRWNLLGGPDFRGARLRFGGAAEITVDVELHLHAEDWAAHAHQRDRAYDGVALHVVLFPPPAGHVTRGANDCEIPVLVLLPLLHHDLEEFAAEDAVESLAGRVLARAPEELAALDDAALEALLRTHAEARWRQKVHFARLRMQRLGWEAACHHVALEILGYRFNRAPMLQVAARWPLAEWAAGRVDGEGAFAASDLAWSLQGVRPANHPRTRLRQYAAWAHSHPDWPGRLAALATMLPVPPATLDRRAVRKVHAFSRLRANVADEICGEAVGGTRLDNLICDGFLPLLAARAGRDFLGLWFHWFPGDLPPLLSRSLRQLGVFDRRGKPAGHGPAQGLLGWLVERAAR